MISLNVTRKLGYWQNLIPFRTGRIDCVPDQDLKWTPYPFEATKKEKHSNTYGTGIQAIGWLIYKFSNL